MNLPHRLTPAVALLIAITTAASSTWADAPAFQGAQGFGADATGGRNAQSIYVVTNLNDSGAGSFRDAVSGSNRIIVFAVSGQINLQSAISAKSNLTILGQTAPGQGIAIQGREVSFDKQSNDIIQYMRFREGTGDPSEKASINLGSTTNFILDHVSVEFAQYDNIDAVGDNGVKNLTIQNSILADPIKAQQFNMHTEGSNVTYLANIWANSHNRNPLAKSDTQYVNNVIYNYQGGYTTGDSGGTYRYDLLNNYFIAGPSTSSPSNAWYQLDSNQSAYSSGNMLDSNKNGKLDGSASTPGSVVHLSSEWSPATKYLPTLTADQAYAFTTAHAGDLYNNGNGAFGRDQVDNQVLSQVESLGTQGFLYNTENTNGSVGFGTIPATSSPANTLDTVPFAWLQAHGLSTTDPNDLLKKNALGYTMIEQYASEIADQYATQTWTNSSGSWASGTWNSATPGAYDHAYILGNGSANGSATIADGDTANAFSVTIGGNGPGGGESLNVSGGSLNVQATITVGDQNNAALNISGGNVFAYNVQLGNTVLDSNGTPTATYTGTLNLTGGTLTVQQLLLGGGTYGAWNSGGVFTWNGGTLQAFNNLTVNVPATLGDKGGIIDSNGYNGTLSGILSGNGGLTKIGGGAITLSAHNTYNGPTTVSAGSLLVTGSLAANGSNAISLAPDGVTTISRATAANASYDNWGSSASADLDSHADLRAGQNATNNSSGESVTMAWRIRTSAETAGTSTGAQLESDALTLTGMANTGTTGSGQTDPFALQMSYLPTSSETTLLWNNGTLWANAVLGNYLTGTQVFADVRSSWDAFAAAHNITDANLGTFLGSWGFDPTSDTVWAVLDHNSTFAAGVLPGAAPVPEPATLSLLAFAGAPLLRRKRSVRVAR
ncbi:MAG TPA: autotransporter-associated beta strand repeat-containing protein [Phycisphaerae bacterium]|nr:autotransporter-associated beta strand repeat-containing protein [Phycisphaerae bacterium]